jgi:hypothetical protein
MARRAAFGLLAALSLAAASPAEAQDAPDQVQPMNELFSGFDLGGNATSGYLGGGTSFGKGLWTPGWRARAVGSLGRYDYDSSLMLGGDSHRQNFDGNDGFIAALAGYQFQKGRATYQLFAGIEAEDQNVSPDDPSNPVQGHALGVLLQGSAWFDLSPRSYLSVDASYGSAFNEYWSLACFGIRVRKRLSLGIEGGALGNEAYDAGRGGGFVRIDFRDTQITLSSGVSGDYLQSQGSAYLSLNVYRAF